MTVQLHIDGAKISFDPSFRTLRDIILTLMSEIVTSAQELPRVTSSFFILRSRFYYDATAATPLKNHYVYYYCVYIMTE